jgi:hypothetical protein
MNAKNQQANDHLNPAMDLPHRKKIDERCISQRRISGVSISSTD